MEVPSPLRVLILVLGVTVAGGTLAEAQSSERLQAEQAPGTGAWANYDFVPGERILFAEDFTNDTVGDFPRRLNLVRGNWEIVEWQGRRLLRNTGPRGAAVEIELPEPLPERFTIELEVYLPHGNQLLDLGTSKPQRPLHTTKSMDGNHFRIGGRGTGVVGGRKSEVESLTPLKDTFAKALTPVRIMVDGQYAKVFVGERRVANVPNASFERGRIIPLENAYFADEKNPMLLGSIRIAAGGRDLYDVLEKEGRVSTQGIYFATNSDRIRPESTPTLKEIGDMPKRMPICGCRSRDTPTATATTPTTRSCQSAAPPRSSRISSRASASTPAGSRLRGTARASRWPTMPRRKASSRTAAWSW